MKMEIWARINNYLSQFYFQFVPAIAWATNINLNNTQGFPSLGLRHNYTELLLISQRFDGAINFLITKKSELQSLITWSFSNYEQVSDTDGNSDFDVIIDAILVPEPIDQPIPVEPIGSVGDDD